MGVERDRKLRTLDIVAGKVPLAADLRHGPALLALGWVWVDVVRHSSKPTYGQRVVSQDDGVETTREQDDDIRTARHTGLH
tara:strand:+ start:268 stop:510 length:243 start_codon:yes stop_codon:yes gene_type:complete